MLIDSHCHLNHPRLQSLGGPDTVVANAKAAGVGGMLTICCRIAEEFDDILAIARRHDNVWCSVGTHPHDAGSPAEMAFTEDKLIALAQSDSKIVGIGESGLDYFYKHSTPEAQQESFRRHIRACIATDLPLIVHARDADEDVMRIIREEGAGTKLKGVLHCFSSGRTMAEDALDFGFYISFSGIVTFKKADDLRSIVDMVPLNRILVETDAPFLAPEPDRGKVNEPALLRTIVNVISQVKKIHEREVVSNCYKNFFSLFNKAIPC